MDRLSELRCLAEKFRAALPLATGRFPPYLRGRLQAFPRNCCDHASALLGRFLQENGFPDVEYVYNAYRGTRAETHAWLLVDREIVVDITASQFPDQPEEIIVRRDSAWHAGFEHALSGPVEEQLRLNRMLRSEYDRAYHELRKVLYAPLL